MNIFFKILCIILICALGLGAVSNIFDIQLPELPDTSDNNNNTDTPEEEKEPAIFTQPSQSFSYEATSGTSADVELNFGCYNYSVDAIRVSYNGEEILSALGENTENEYLVCALSITAHDDYYGDTTEPNCGFDMYRGTITFNNVGTYEFYFITSSGEKSPAYIFNVTESVVFSLTNWHTEAHETCEEQVSKGTCSECGTVYTDYSNLTMSYFETFAFGSYDAYYCTCGGEVIFSFVHCFIDGVCHHCQAECTHSFGVESASTFWMLPEGHPLHEYENQDWPYGGSYVVDGICQLCGMPVS